ncbi:hypothetical protein PsorP6_004134 [Peronosclerospora sorghi]|uniref:Uncharacterized protein n=1 Tax=Peronosclerospora sorghi TaxID=230839 RepID=A0ACC0VLI3_9STRA|nr:hypothetical protein PsorP6_004134 [Peronosclerospora sorghi]
MKHIRNWVTVCIVLHNMIAHLGDASADLYEGGDVPEEAEEELHGGIVKTSSECRRDDLKLTTIAINYARGFLPMQ